METEVLIALIAAFVSFLGLVISKEQKISEFRQEWINGLRQDIANLLAQINNFELKYIIAERKAELEKVKFNGIEFIQENIDITHNLQKYSAIIKLRLNPNDSDELIRELDKIGDVITSPSLLADGFSLNTARERFKAKSHEVLKAEWERVKKGEPWFIVSKWIVGFVLIFIFLFFVKDFV